MKFTLAMLERLWNLPDAPILIQTTMPGLLADVRFIRSVSEISDPEILYIPAPDFTEWDLLASQEQKYLFLIIFQDNKRNVYMDTLDWKIFKSKRSSLGWIFIPDVYSHLTIVNEILRILHTYHSWENEFFACMHREHPLEEALILLCRLLNNPGYIVDRNFRGIVMINNQDLASLSINWKRLYEHGYLPLDVVSSIMNSEQWKQICREHRPVLCKTKEFYVPFVTVNIRIGSQLQWQLFITEIRQNIKQSDLDILQVLTPYFAELLKSDTANFTPDVRLYEHFLLDVLHGEIHQEREAADQLAALGWGMGDSYMMAAFHFPENEEDFQKLSLWTASRSWIRIVRDEKIFLGFLHITEKIPEAEICKDLEEMLKFTEGNAGISEIFNGFLKAKDYQEQAKAVLGLYIEDKQATFDSGNKMPSGVIRYTKRACEIFGGMLTALERTMLYPPLYQKIADFDRAHNTQYLETLYVFLSHDRNLVRTAESLHIHRNTLVYRIGKIGQLFDFDFEDPDLRLRFMCACRFLGCRGVEEKEDFKIESC